VRVASRPPPSDLFLLTKGDCDSSWVVTIPGRHRRFDEDCRKRLELLVLSLSIFVTVREDVFGSQPLNVIEGRERTVLASSLLNLKLSVPKRSLRCTRQRQVGGVRVSRASGEIATPCWIRRRLIRAPSAATSFCSHFHANRARRVDRTCREVLTMPEVGCRAMRDL